MNEHAKFAQDNRAFEWLPWVITGGTDGYCTAYDPNENRIMGSFAAHSDSVSGLAYLEAEEKLVTSSYDGLIHIWEVSNTKLPWRAASRQPSPIGALSDNEASFTCLDVWRTFEKGSYLVAAGNEAGRVSVFDIRTG